MAAMPPSTLRTFPGSQPIVSSPPPSSLEQFCAEQAAYKRQRESGYRARALKLFPWICGRCAREFDRRNLSELTVHHIDHNHDNNPADGSNWELLCIYCHDEEHRKFESHVRYGRAGNRELKPATYSPFADLKNRLQAEE
jgi:hypothetical protein